MGGPLAEELARTGIVKLTGVFGDDDGERMRRVLWGELAHRYGIERDDPSTWDRHPPTGLRTTKKSRAFTPMCGPLVRDALDVLFGPGGWVTPEVFGQVLVTMPSSAQWRVPDRLWHSDFLPSEPQEPLGAVKLWALFDDIEPGGGGTPQLAGSHRLFARYLEDSGERDYKRAKFGFLRSHPWLRALSRDAGEPDRNHAFMDEPTTIDGVELQVVECTGRTGDVYVTHPWVFHSIAVNASHRPRLMRSFAIKRTG